MDLETQDKCAIAWRNKFYRQTNQDENYVIFWRNTADFYTKIRQHIFAFMMVQFQNSEALSLL